MDDMVIDSWMNCLARGGSIWFEDLCREDIEGREKAPRQKADIRKRKEPEGEGTSGGKRKRKSPEGEGTSGSGGRSFKSVIDEVNELKDIMEDYLIGLNAKLEGVVQRLDDMDGRVKKVEDVVAELASSIVRDPPPPPPHTEEGSVSVRKEKKRSRSESKESADEDVEDITQPAKKAPPKKKAPAKKAPPKKKGPENTPENSAEMRKRKTKRLSRV